MAWKFIREKTATIKALATLVVEDVVLKATPIHVIKIIRFIKTT